MVVCKEGKEKVENICVDKKDIVTFKMDYLGRDYWGRNTYKATKTGEILKEVDGILCSITPEGEPLSPIKKYTILHKDKEGNLHIVDKGLTKLEIEKRYPPIRRLQPIYGE